MMHLQEKQAPRYNSYATCKMYATADNRIEESYMVILMVKLGSHNQLHIHPINYGNFSKL